VKWARKIARPGEEIFVAVRVEGRRVKILRLAGAETEEQILDFD